MKNIFKYILVGTVGLTTLFSCIKDDVNQDPNNPQEVPSNMLMSGAEKWIVDNIYDVWFSGRQCMLYAQYWAQRNYTEEDRYQIRESVNNSYFNYLYQGVANLIKVEQLNTDAATAAGNSAYGANANQVAAAKILKAWLMDVITDTWGSVPYTDVAKLATDQVYYCKYDDQKDLYAALIAELDAAVAMIDESEPAFTSGDIIYGGDASKWKKFGNSLKCRLAVHTSKVDPNWKSIVSAAVADGVFESNDDAAAYSYSASGTDYCKIYEGYYVDGRNDLTITKPFANLLMGVKDDLNGKTHPWEGVRDPRADIYSPGLAKGMPYGAPSIYSAKLRGGTPNWYSMQPGHLTPDFKIPLMTFAEVQFIISESKGFSDAEFKAGIEASIDYWADAYGDSADAADVAAYIAAVGTADAEKVAVQKYIDLWMNGTEAWTEIRRTGYPEQLVRPGEYTVENPDDPTAEPIKFTVLSEVNDDIIARVKYPTNESTLNGENWKAAVAKLQDGSNNYYSKMFWDVRTSPYDHPANK